MLCVLKNIIIFKNYNITKKNNYLKKLNKNIFIYKNIFNSVNMNIHNKKNHLTFYFKLNNNFYYNMNNFNKFYFNKFYIFMNSFFKHNNNILIIDDEYKSMVPLYNFMYGLKEMKSEKKFFFLKKNFMSLNNFMYFYGLFLKKWSIKSLMFLDYFNFNKFFKIFLSFNLPILAVSPQNMEPVYMDYFYYFNNHNLNLYKLLIYNQISFLYFQNFKLNSIINKNKFYLIKNKLSNNF